MGYGVVGSAVSWASPEIVEASLRELKRGRSERQCALAGDGGDSLKVFRNI